MEQNDFRVLIKRLPGYVPLVSLRFEMSEGYGELIVGDDRKAAPAASGEIVEVTGEQVRAGRFVHVLASGRRRQSYSLSHLDDARLLRLDDQRWTLLTSTTEFGLRYLDLPDLDATGQIAAVTVSASPAPGRAHHPGSAQPAGPRVALPHQAGSSASPAPARAAVPVGTPAVASASASASPAQPRTAAPRAPSLRTEPPSLAPDTAAADSLPPDSWTGSAAPHSIGVALTDEAVRRLSITEARTALLQEIGTNRALHQRVVELEQQLRASVARERDLIELIARWQSRG